MKQKLLPETELVQYLTMETLREGDELIFLYQLVPGLSDISYACHIAAGVGLPANMVQRAAEVLGSVFCGCVCDEEYHL